MQSTPVARADDPLSIQTAVEMQQRQDPTTQPHDCMPLQRPESSGGQKPPSFWQRHVAVDVPFEACRDHYGSSDLPLALRSTAQWEMLTATLASTGAHIPGLGADVRQIRPLRRASRPALPPAAALAALLLRRAGVGLLPPRQASRGAEHCDRVVRRRSRRLSVLAAATVRGARQGAELWVGDLDRGAGCGGRKFNMTATRWFQSAPDLMPTDVGTRIVYSCHICLRGWRCR